MNMTFLNQRAGVDTIGDTLNALLVGKRFHHVKFLMAFVNEGGLAVLKHSLEKFYDNGGILEFIVGVDQGVTTQGALDYLRHRFPDASVFLFHDESRQVTFHPKVVICESDDEAVCIVGSGNLTLGGLFSNCECGLLIELNRHKDEVELQDVLSVWDAYRNPAPPFEPNHLRELTTAWLRANAKMLRTATLSARKSGLEGKFKGFGKVRLRFPKIPTLSNQPKPSTVPKSAAKRSAGRRLYLEVLKETGAGGTQVQIPVDVITEYFKGDLGRSQHLRLTFDNRTFKDAYIHHFNNNTHRMSINEVAMMKRPLLISFAKLPHFHSSYMCKLISGKDYHVAVKRCARQTRLGAKQWGIQ